MQFHATEYVRAVAAGPAAARPMFGRIYEFFPNYVWPKL